MKHPGYAVYILYSHKDHQFYIGYTTDFERRMSEHKEGRSKATAGRRPFSVVLCEYYFTKTDATRRELYFKTTAGKRTLRLMLKESLNEVAQLTTENIRL